MAVDTRRIRYTTLAKDLAETKEFVKSDLQELGAHAIFRSNLMKNMKMSFKSSAHLTARAEVKTDFVVTEMKRTISRASLEQLTAYLRMPLRVSVRHILPLKTDALYRSVFVHKRTETPPEFVKVARPIKVFHPNEELVLALLGSKGKYVLGQVIRLTKDLALEMDWPLDRIEIRYIRDLEVEGWAYILVLLVFSCDFDTAESHLHELYNQIDMLTEKLSDKEQDVLRRMIFFDIKTEASISSD